MRFGLRERVVADDAQQRNNEDLVNGLNAVAQFVDMGDGAPLHTPDHPAIYFRQDGTAGSAVYLFDGTSWTAVA